MIIRATHEIIRAIRQMIRTIVRMVFARIIWNSLNARCVFLIASYRLVFVLYVRLIVCYS